jgi:hypothetical protein
MRSTRHLLTVALCVLAGLAQAQTAASRFRSAELQVLQATRYVNEPQGQDFRTGTDLQFTRRVDAPKGEVSLRVFSLDGSGSVPRPWAVFDPCFVYYAAPFDLRVNDNGTIKPGNISMHWLEPGSDGAMHPRRFLLVFETGASDRDPVLRLNKDQRDAYFARGLVIEVRPGRSFSADEVRALAADQAAGRAGVQQATQRNEPGLPCYRARMAGGEDADAPLQLAQADDCSPA